MMSSSKHVDAGRGTKDKSVAGGVSAAAKLRTDVILSPDTAACEGNSNICLIFDETPKSLINGNGRVEISIQMNEKLDRIAAKRINDRTFSFLAPDNREGDASVVVFVNGAEQASCYLHYRSDTVHLVTGLSQIYLQFLSTVCRYMYTLQTKHQIPNPIMPELDRLLAESFEDRDDKNNIPIKTFEEFFDVFRHSSSTDSFQSKYELPTLLHLTGEYGLEQLALRLLDLPGARKAGNIFNQSGLTATELARNNGYLKLAKTISLAQKVDARNPLTLPKHGSKLSNLMLNDQHPRPKPSFAEDDYVLPTDLEDNYDVFPEHPPPNTAAASGRPKKQPPLPCQKFIDRKMSAISISESQQEFPTLPPPRSSVGVAAPPIPRRESRDSGVGLNVDVSHALDQLPTAPRKRPPLTRGLTEPEIDFNEAAKYVPGRRGSQDVPGNAIQRNPSFPGEEIARQLKKPVHAPNRPRRPSVT